VADTQYAGKYADVATFLQVNSKKRAVLNS